MTTNPAWVGSAALSAFVANGVGVLVVIGLSRELGHVEACCGRGGHFSTTMKEVLVRWM